MLTLAQAQAVCPVVVGNGALAEGMGEIIDGFRCVVRLNNYQLAGWESQAGRKTDIVAACVDLNGAQTCNPEAVKASQIWWAGGYAQTACPSQCWKVMAQARGLNVFMFDRPEYYSTMIGLYQLMVQQVGNPDARLSTGLAAILFALRMVPHVVLAGFDWGHTGHYFDAHHQHDPKHPWNWEREYVQKLAREGAVRFLTEF